MSMLMFDSKFFEGISSSKLLLLGNLLRIVSLLKDDILFEVTTSLQ